MLNIYTKSLDPPRVRIRGIYSTALTKIFLEEGFEIVQPSDEIAERFNFKEKAIKSPHVDIWDMDNKQGVNVEFFSQLKDKLMKLFLGTFNDAIIRQEKFQTGSVYKGVLYRPAPWGGGYIVKLTPNSEGYLPINELERRKFSIGDTIVVEVKEARSEHRLPLLSTKISIPGDYAVLIPEETVKISHRIKGDTRIKLLEIGEILRPEGWGIIWRTSSMSASLDELKEELEALKEEAEKLIDTSEKAPALTKIREGLETISVEFPKLSKDRLDEIRGEVVPTVRGHHWFKSFGNSVTEIVDFSEKILAKEVNIDTLSRSVYMYVKNKKFPKTGEKVKIKHIKISGKEVILGPARVVDLKERNDNITLYMYRRFKPGGFYDGIDAQKEVGDYGITIASSGDSKLVTVYFDVEDRMKGIYVNINTPIEIYKGEIRYIDLEVDVVVDYNGNIKILDTQKLAYFLENGNISDKLYNFAMRKADEYREWLSDKGLNEIKDICKEIRDKALEDENELIEN